MVCRSRALHLPYTVTELRPLSAVVAAASWALASAVIDATSMDVDGGTGGPPQAEGTRTPRHAG
jgi:hypothetical protein